MDEPAPAQTVTRSWTARDNECEMMAAPRKFASGESASVL